MGVQNIVKEIKLYQKKWLKHVQRMDTNRPPKQALQYKPKGRRNIGRSRKRWRDQLHLEDQGTGNTPNPSGTKVATWNVRGIAEKTEELQTELLKRKIDIAILTETKKKNKGSEDIGNYVMIYCGVPANQWASSGVAIAIRKDWKHNIQDYT